MQDLLGGRQDMDFLSGHFMKRKKEELCKALKLQVGCDNAGCRLARTIYCWKLCSEGTGFAWAGPWLHEQTQGQRRMGRDADFLALGENQGSFYPDQSELELLRLG